MKTVSRWTTALVMLSGAAYGQVPSTNDTSDGFGNTGMGTNALISVTPGTGFKGIDNTAAGYNALGVNTIGFDNAAFGSWALDSNTTGSNNTATGSGALLRNFNGDDNTASGFQSLFYNRSGSRNAASGAFSLEHNTSGSHNTAFGANALNSNTTGSDNIAVGFHSGYDLTTGSNNIDIGNPGEARDGETADSGVIRIGTQTPTALQTNTYIAGIYDNASISGLAVIIDSNGQLGTVKSSERYKTAIAPMGSNTEKLQQLRPVTFHYKADAQGTLRYGLIAEEVAKVYPELAVRDSQGRIEGVRYDELAPMLLNELQQQKKTVAIQSEKIAAQAAINAAQRKQIVAQNERIAAQGVQLHEVQRQMAEIHAALSTLKSKDWLFAQR